MPVNDRMPCIWSRRSFLVALTVGSLTALSGCRVRLENDAPRRPDLPTRQPMPDELALLLAHRDALRLRDLAAGLGGSSTALTELLATLHGLQANVFESLLRSGGVPPAEISATPTTTATAGGAASTRATATPAPTAGGAASAPLPAPSAVSELATAEAEGLSVQALSGLAGISMDRVALFGSMTAQRAAAARLLGSRLPSAGTLTGPTGGTLTGPTGEVAATQLEAIRSAVYGFEVVVAQTDTSHRKEAAETLGALRACSSELQLLAGSAAKPIPLGYALPFPVSTPASALRLATHLMTALRESIASQLPAVAGDSAGLTGTVHLLTDVCVHAVTWRVPLTAFPGLTDT
ncbi:MAG: DUF4439 domain-containing protein [Dermatophilaceae bacterium]